jgi:hypothetical protein
MTLSVGMMKFPTAWKNKNHVPNHQPDNNPEVDRIFTDHSDIPIAFFF